MATINYEQLTLATLSQVNPYAEGFFQKHIRNCVNDVMTRPGDPEARTITLEFTITPIVRTDPTSLDRSCTEVAVSCSGKSKIPVMRTEAIPMKMGRGGELLFNPECPQNLHQPALPMGEPDPREQ